MNALQIGRAADELPLVAARFFEQNLHRLAHPRTVKGLSLVLKQHLQPRQSLVFFRLGHLFRHRRAGRAGRRRIFEGIGRCVANFFDEGQCPFKILTRFARETNDEVARNGDIRPRGADFLDEPKIVLSEVWPRFMALRILSDPDCTGRCRYGISFSSSPKAAINPSSMSRGWDVMNRMRSMPSIFARWRHTTPSPQTSPSTPAGGTGDAQAFTF